MVIFEVEAGPRCDGGQRYLDDMREVLITGPSTAKVAFTRYVEHKVRDTLAGTFAPVVRRPATVRSK
jgi:hypothetical protein